MTRREVEVCVLAGCFGVWMSDKKIAEELKIGACTVRAHMANGAGKIRKANPHLRGSPRRVCQAWVRQAYHQMAARALAA